MKKISLSLALILMSGFFLFLHAQTKVNSITDNRDGTDYKTIEINGNTWMVQNMNYSKISACWCYENAEVECEKNGRLYSYEAAGKACPGGWHLPSETDFTNLFSNAVSEMERITELSVGGSSGFNLQFAGYRSGLGAYFGRGNQVGYWLESTSKKKNRTAMYFDKNSKTIKVIIVKNMEIAYSVRCVKN